ncbi:hypothetical protein BH10CHL1_BH10CHL1_06900 [soil metagenome]
MLNYIRHSGAWLLRYWLSSTVIAFALLMAYTSLPIFGQSPTPTPNIQTVPKLEITSTPTNTPFPTVTAVVPDIPQVPTPVPTAKPTAKPDKADKTEENAVNDPGTAGGDPINKPAGGEQAPALQAPISNTKQLLGSVLVAVLNLRKSPSSNAAIIDTLFHQDQVQILGRNSDGFWWLVCCGAETQKPGWVTAQLLSPNFNPAQANTLLPLLAGSNATSLTDGSPITTSKTVNLQLQMRPSPAFVWQGQMVDLQFIVTNLSKTAAVNVRLRDDLTTTLQYNKAVITHNGRLQQQDKPQGGKIFNIGWPQLAAGASVTATLTLRVAPDLANGSLIDNLAVVAADNAGDVSAGITFAMPPTIMPQFK